MGGTNTNIGIAGINNSKLFFLFSLNFKSKQLKSLIPAILETLSYSKEKHNIDVKYSCIGAAGVVSSNNDFAKLTNVSWNVDVKEILKKTSLKKIYVINDFEAIGYGINLLDSNNKKDIFEIRGKKDLENRIDLTKTLIGAGTGLGKSILIYNPYYNLFKPNASEGGHADFPIYNNFDFRLTSFIKKFKKINKPISYEDILSGRGLVNIYLFIKNLKKYKSTKYTEKIDKSSEKPPLISQYKSVDETCKETFRIYTRYYARCAKNFVLDSMAIGGLYIAGGIASKNKDIFNTPEFIKEFENSFGRKDLLKNIPIYVITNYDISLYGTFFAAMYFYKTMENHNFK